MSLSGGGTQTRPRNAAVQWIAAVIILALARCSAYRAPEPLVARAARYLDAHPETPVEVTEAIRLGHVLVHMNREQVKAAVGPPEWRHQPPGTAQTEVWLYHGARLQLGQKGTHGADLLRVVFVDGRVRIIEPL